MMRWRLTCRRSPACTADALLCLAMLVPQSVIALRFEHGATQLRFGDDFGLSLFKRELRRLLPQGVDHWRRQFGFHTEKAAVKDEGEEGDEDEDDEEGGDGGAAGEDEDEDEDEP